MTVLRQKLNEQKTLRVTGLQSFEECPHRWANETYRLVPERKSPYAQMGTAVHSVVEQYFKGTLPQYWEQVFEFLEVNGVNEAERMNVYRYLDMLPRTGFKPGLLEHEFVLEAFPDALPIIGHIDAIGVGNEDMLTIMDHKTNRSYEDADTWKHKLQPRLYTWAARKLFDAKGPIRFIIGYVNLGTFVQWTYTPEDDEETMARYRRIWDEITRYTANGFFEQRFNSGCRFCAVREKCDTYQNHTVGFKDSVLNIIEKRSIGERVELLKTVIKVAQAALDEVEEHALKQAIDNGGVFEDAGYEFAVKRSSRRHVQFSEFWSALWEQLHERDDEVLHLIREMYDEMFSVKVTGVDKMLKLHPELRVHVEDTVKLVESEEPSLSIKKVKKPVAITS